MSNTPGTEANELINLRHDRAAVLARLQPKSPEELNALLPYLFSTGYTGAEIEALRTCVQGLIDIKLSAEMSTSIRELNSGLSSAVDELNRSTTKLTRIGWIVSSTLALVTILLPLLLSQCR